MNLGNNIKTIRLAYGMSQSEFAEKLGVSNQAVSAWETGTRTPLMGIVQKLSTWYNIDKDILIDGVVTQAQILGMKNNSKALRKLYDTARYLSETKINYLIKMAESLKEDDNET